MYYRIVNRLSAQVRIRIVAALVEGNSVRATCRMTGAAKGTVLKLLGDLGQACAAYQEKHLRGLTCRRVQCDEIWAFCYAKEKNVPQKRRGEWGYGDVWTWTALDADSKLIVCWYVGRRNPSDARRFIRNLYSRLATRVQLTTDGLGAYLPAVTEAFGTEVDYAQLVKIYNTPTGDESQTRYSPARCTGAVATAIKGDPKFEHISTSYVERQNLTIRMQMRRFTRLTNAFSKKVENLEHALALHFLWYNFGRVHQTHKMTPAMAAGLADHPWTLGEIVDLCEHKFAGGVEK
jgi:IS1 family transposase